jgi:hypothetical protein
MGTQSGEISGQSLHSVERRKHIRYRLDLPAIFSWESSQRSRLQGEGVTRDIGLEGVFIFTATCPPADATVYLDVLFPLFCGTAPSGRIKAEARVLRVEHSAGGQGLSGFAVVSQGFTLWPAVKETKKNPGPGTTERLN